MVSQATERGLSQRRACRLADVARSSARYQAHPRDDQALREQLEQIKHKYPRFRHPTRPCAAAGGGPGHQPQARGAHLGASTGCKCPQRPKKRKIRTGRPVPCQAEHPDHVWSYDFQEDGLLSGRKLRILSVLDEFTREWLSVSVGVSLTSQAVLMALKPLFASRAVPRFVRSDNGPEFIAAAVKTWLQESGCAPHYIDPGCPWQNGFQESFHGKLRDELLDREVFASVTEAQARLESQRRLVQ